MKKLLGVFFAILFLPVCARANSITFTSDANIQAGDSWMNVYIYATPPNHTTVTMTGGSVNDSMGVFDAATFNMSGGNVGVLNAYNYSSVNISGGTVSAIQVFDNATVTISQNANIWTVAAYSGVINMNGGVADGLSCMENSTVNLRGGDIIDALGAYGSTTINVFGYNLAKTSTGGTYGVGQVTGFWQNNSQFTINLAGSEAYSHVNLIPEPATFLLFGIGAFLFRRRIH